ncbi:UTP--glucose-1-phosphate uridylyltransferase [Candidatus Haliotispira prima]|uniref:UTP--glucose-1-phosphate uridylyltransferase n=1 Tax=Candidatus Haliotispira prima TaxID=3034016 RepID=A0ABY8ME51_9SPIO|nr:UTP--glucose-1-phosphate uridylyltransferase [Candidatus Haliotispira prima]
MDLSGQISTEEREAMRRAKIDVGLSLQILETLNRGGVDRNSSNFGSASATAATDFEIPTVDGKDIVDLSGPLSYRVKGARIHELLQQYPELQAGWPARYAKAGAAEDLSVNEQEINELGLLLSPYFAFGVLNGGSASSYFDNKKNESFSPELFRLFRREFDGLARDFSHLPKALCPAFLTEQGPGPGFMGLKLRSLLYTIQRQRALRRRCGLSAEAAQQPKFFQMTSELTHGPLRNYIYGPSCQLEGTAGTWRGDPAGLESLAAELGWWPDRQISSEKQPLISTFARSADPGTDSGSRWQFFRDRNGNHLAMPGGHGQCFFALRQRLEELYRKGTRYISLGNIDNVAYNPQPGFIGLLALSGRTGFFSCSYRSSVDVKGGVLLRPRSGSGAGRLNCFDIGTGVDKDILQIAEEKERDLLFNCAIGYFDLGALLAEMENIIACLPLRISEQNKDRGHYWQVEQVTWEAIGLLDSVLIGAVRKEDHFLAAKLQLEALVNTAYRLECYEGKSEGESPEESLHDLAVLARRFAAGYAKVLQRDCNYAGFGQGH